MSSNLLQNVKERANVWLSGKYDEQTVKEVKKLLEGTENDLIDAFYRDLEFGTGGLRGVMGAGTNRMNIYTVGMATQGLSNYIKAQFTQLKQVKVAVAYDSRNNSKLFAETAAKIFAANHFKVYLFESLRPTPELSFAIRHFGCQSGIVITASHNPKEYNGYKAYWEDGGQVISPHDKNIISEVEKIKSIDEVEWSGKESNIELVGDAVDTIYTDKILSLSLSPDIIKRNKDIKIVYTPIHGSGVMLVPLTLQKFGFTNIIHVPEQDVSDGNFPTVKSPNPEEPAALSLAIAKARETGAELVLATDPDADRVGIAVKDNKGEFILLNGNQTASVLIYYLISKWSEKGKLKGHEYIVKTIVTTELLADIARKFKVEYFDVLTGFKYIADKIEKNQCKKQFIGGGEESYGYLEAEFVRDKDAVMSAALIAEAATWAKDIGKSFFEVLLDLYTEFGLYKETLVSVVRKGKTGAEEIDKMMQDFRSNPPQKINNSTVVCIKDYQLKKSFDKVKNTETDIDLPKSNVLQFFLEDGSKISVRPSGTEPKIKFYFGMKEKLVNKADYEKVNKLAEEKIQNIIKDLKLN
jgi:phosphoglucomutase